MNNESWIAVDLDGTLAHYESGAQWDGYSIGKPIPKMIERVKQLLNDGKNVKIFTARISKNGDPRGVENVEKIIGLIQDWCEEHIGQRLEVVNEKDYFMVELWDDRARQVVQNEGVFIDELLSHYYTTYKELHKRLPNLIKEVIEEMKG